MLNRIVHLCRRVVAGSPRESTRLVLGGRPEPGSHPIIGVDFSGTRASAAYADAVLTAIEPATVMDTAAYLARSGLAPAAWWIGGVGELPYTAESTADFLVEFCRVSRCDVYVDTAVLTAASSRRLVAYLRRSAADARRRSLSPRVRVLSSGRNAG